MSHVLSLSRVALRDAMRSIFRHQVVSLTVVGVLAVTLAPVAAVFGIVNALVLTPLPVTSPETLVQVADIGGRDLSFSLLARVSANTDLIYGVCGLRRGRLRASVRYSGTPLADLSYATVTADCFSSLGLQPALGSWANGGTDAIIVSHSYWQRELGADRNIVGGTLAVGRDIKTIVAVAPERFVSFDPAQALDAWAVMDGSEAAGSNPTAMNLRVLARLHPSYSLEQVAEVLSIASVAWSSEHGVVPPVRLALRAAPSGLSDSTSTVVPSLLALQGVAGLLLAVAFANLTLLVTARSVGRARETSVAVALGVPRFMVVGAVAIEAVLLCLGGGVLSLLLLPGLYRRLLSMFASVARVPIDRVVAIDERVVLLVGAASLVSAVLLAVVPSLVSLSSPDLTQALRETPGSRSSSRATATSVVLLGVQVTLVCLLMHGMATFGMSLARLAAMPLGFQSEGVTVVSTRLAPSLPQGSEASHYSSLLDRAKQAAATSDVAIASEAPFSTNEWAAQVRAEPGGVDTDRREPMQLVAVSPAFFDVLGIRRLEGRAFSDGDHENMPPVAVLNLSAARQLFGATPPLGHPLWIDDPEPETALTVVGLVDDVRYVDAKTPPRPTVYLPYRQHPEAIRQASLLVRTPRSSSAGSRLAVELQLDGGGVRLGAPLRLSDLADGSLRRERVLTGLAAWLCGVGFALAGIGLYSAGRLEALRRTQEIGLRLALGASTRQAAIDTVRPYLIATLVASVAGALLGSSVSRVFESIAMLAPSPARFLTIGTMVVVGVSSVAALYIPAWTASRRMPARVVSPHGY